VDRETVLQALEQAELSLNLSMKTVELKPSKRFVENRHILGKR